MTVVDLYTIQIVRDFEPWHEGPLFTTADALMAETEENLTDLLPPGYRARIRRWDHADEEEIECEHKWRDYSEYGGDFKPGELTCKYCGATKADPDEGENDE